MRTLVTRGVRRLRTFRAAPSLLLPWLVALVGIEIFGRRARSDAADAVSVLVLAALGAATLIHCGREPLALTARLRILQRALRQRVARLRIRAGLDLRGTPPLPRRTPPLLCGPLAAAGGACALAGVLGPWLPGGLRAALLQVSATLNAVWLGAFWLVLATATLALFAIPFAHLVGAAERGRAWRYERWRAQVVAATCYLIALAVAAVLLPLWVPFAIVLAGLSAYLVVWHLPRGPALLMLWKPVGVPGDTASVHWRALATGEHLFFVAVALALSFVACGDRLWGAGAGETPLTTALGVALSWTFCGAFVAEVCHLITVLLRGWRSDPALPVPARVLVESAVGATVRRRVRAALRAAGFAVAFPPARDRHDVPIVIVAERAERDPFAPPVWPRPVTLAALRDPELHAALRRRDRILRRRSLLRGIRRAFKEAKRRRFARGCGYWIAPHLWFVTHLSRDVDDDPVAGMSVTPWRRLVPRAARHHMHAVMRDLELDLIFVEDGVTFRSLKRVLLMMFEYHDMFGSRRLDDERHFCGLPGVRVILHDHSLEEPFRWAKYPEPDYDEVGRARILHVFRDRGADTEDERVPLDLDWLPLPLAPEPVTG